MKSLGDNDMYAVVRRSHPTTRLILLPGYTTHGIKLPFFLKFVVDNDMNAIVRRSHPTTHLVLLPRHATHKKTLLLFQIIGR